MSVLIGHPTGNVNSHQAALAHAERQRLAAFCVSWMPSPTTIGILSKLPGLNRYGKRLAKRTVPELYAGKLIQDRFGEWGRLFRRVMGKDPFDCERMAYETNDWLMEVMATESANSQIDVVHAYEDCALESFKVAKNMGKACLYDLPIGFYPEWQLEMENLVSRYREWVPVRGFPELLFVRPEQKRQEMELADLVLVPSEFVSRTVSNRMEKRVVLAPYGVDCGFWKAKTLWDVEPGSPLRFLFVGHASLRKGVPFLLEAWKAAGLKDAELHLVGQWQLSEQKRKELPLNVSLTDSLPPGELQQTYSGADVFVFPSFFDGYGLVLNEAMACGLPVIASSATGGPDVLELSFGRVFPSGQLDALVEHLRWFSVNRSKIPEMSLAARRKAEQLSWSEYRKKVSLAVDCLT